MSVLRAHDLQCMGRYHCLSATQAVARSSSSSTDRQTDRTSGGFESCCVVAGDSACSIPPQTIPAECLEVIRDWTIKLAKELKVVGLINIQYCIQDNQVSPVKLLLRQQNAVF